MCYLPSMLKVTAATGGFKTWGKGETVIRPLKRCQSLLKLRKTFYNMQLPHPMLPWPPTSIAMHCFKGLPHWMLQMPAPTLISPEAGRGCHTCHTQALQWPPPLFVTIEMILAPNSAQYTSLHVPRYHPYPSISSHGATSIWDGVLIWMIMLGNVISITIMVIF